MNELDKSPQQRKAERHERRRIKSIEETNESLREENEKLYECVEFYADKESWCSESDVGANFGAITMDDFYSPEKHPAIDEGFEIVQVGGKRAHQCLEEIKEHK